MALETVVPKHIANDAVSGLMVLEANGLLQNHYWRLASAVQTVA